MDAGRAIRAAREQAGLSQAELAARAGTSQATLSAYETGRKRPSVATLSRVLGVAGARLTVERKVSAAGSARLAGERTAPAADVPFEDRLARNGRILVDVLALAEALPTRHAPVLRFPRLTRRAAA